MQLSLPALVGTNCMLYRSPSPVLLMHTRMKSLFLTHGMTKTLMGGYRIVAADLETITRLGLNVSPKAISIRLQ